jgi:Zinc carboxypeptidase
MSSRTGSPRLLACALVAAATLWPAASALAQQKNDPEYTALIKKDLTDPRISTELVDHLPASATVPTPLKVLGHIIGEPGIIDHAEDLNHYLQVVAQSAPTRAKFFTIGKSEEGRDMVVLVIANEETIRSLDKYKGYLADLTDPRKTSAARAKQIEKLAKPVYWITSGMHSPERGGPEMLMELAYRLVVDASPFVKDIRDNVITMITPVVEMDGRDKDVDTYNFNKDRPEGEARLPLMYWGKYVQHDNNRDGMGQFLDLTKNIETWGLDWHPTILHDLHEAQTLLYASTGTGPYNEQLDPITIDEWWSLAENDVLEMTKRGVPGVWTYGFYDGWVPNYMFFVVHSHNATGRFYEVQSYGPDTTRYHFNQSREWFRPNPAPNEILWGPRANTNIQESAIMFALHRVARDKELWLDDYWVKNNNAVNKGKTGPVYGWVIPADQRRKADAAAAVNELIDQGLEFHRATRAFKVGNIDVKPGDYIVRGDQPFRTVADIYFAVQNYAIGNPSPYDDTGWTFQYMRDIVIAPCTDKQLLSAPMTPVSGHVQAAGAIAGTGNTVIVEHTGDNNIVTFRYQLKDVAMQSAEQDFDADGHHFRAGAIIINNANRGQIEPLLKQLGLSGYGVASAPAVKTHELDIPRILYLHSWSRTQDEGWVRAALDTYGIPYTYVGDKEVAGMSDIRANYDVVIYPHVGGSAQSIVAGIPRTGTMPLPYEKSARFPSLGTPDSSPDIRGGMGVDGLMNLYRFVQAGGTLITEGNTSILFPDYNLTPGVSIESPDDLFARGSVLRGVIADMNSPLVYGLADAQMPVYFSQGPVINAGGGGGGLAFGRGGAGYSQNTQPMANPIRDISVLLPGGAPPLPDEVNPKTQAAVSGRAGGRGFGRGGRGGRGGAAEQERPRVVMRFPTDTTQMLLSGVLAGGGALAGRAQLVDDPIGKGHVVMFAIRPFWRWQTQGTFILGFNAIMNWNDLSAGEGSDSGTGRSGRGGRRGGGR